MKQEDNPIYWNAGGESKSDNSTDRSVKEKKASGGEVRPFDALVSGKAKAKELAEHCKIGENDTFEAGYVFNKEDFEYFCAQLLKEQRELCAIHAYKLKDGTYDGGIKSTPAPEGFNH